MQNIELISNKIIKRLPYLKSFLFVNEISFIDENKVIGHFSFSDKSFFYNSHFLHIPITPGVILIEMMAQVGMVSHLIFLHKLHENKLKFHPVLHHIDSSFLKQIYINEKLTVISEKEYFLNEILTSNITLYNSKNEVCSLLKAQLQLVYDE